MCRAMKKKSDLYRVFMTSWIKLLVGMLVCSLPASAQMSTQSGRSRAVEQSYSRAEQEAEQLVSLSPERIIPLLLQGEPGLLLQVKKLLVRRAYGQGRLLDPEDLTDEALFRLITTDDYIRAMVTREIEERRDVRENRRGENWRANNKQECCKEQVLMRRNKRVT